MRGKLMLGLLITIMIIVSQSVYAKTGKQVVSYSDHNSVGQGSSLIKYSDLKPWEQWDLSEQDWTKYQEHMKGPRGIWSPNLDPLTVLGVEAESEDERRLYAHKLAMLEFQRAEKELAFQRSYDRAMKSLYPMTPMIDPSKLPSNKSRKTSNQIKLSTLKKTNERLMFFTKIKQCESCRRTEIQLINEWIVHGGSVDFYVTDAIKDNEIRQWAKRTGIKPSWVKNKQVTLNYDKGGLFLASGGTGSAPWLVVKRNNQYLSVK